MVGVPDSKPACRSGCRWPAARTLNEGHMKRQERESRREIRKLKDLKPFPLQKDFFDDLPDHELEALAAGIERNGLRNPIEILPKNRAGYPPNTILNGHQ